MKNKLILMNHDLDGLTTRTGELILECADDANPPRHLEVGKLSLEQAQALRRLRRALVVKGERLAAGREVVTNADAVRWLLEWMSGEVSEK